MKVISLCFWAFAIFSSTRALADDRAALPGLPEITDCKAFRDSLQPGVPVVIVFGATWCPPCDKLKKAMSPVAVQDPQHRYVHIYLDKNPGCNDFVRKYCMDAYPFTTVIDKTGLDRVDDQSATAQTEVQSITDPSDRDAAFRTKLLGIYNAKSDSSTAGEDDVAKVGFFDPTQVNLFDLYKKQYLTQYLPEKSSSSH